METKNEIQESEALAYTGTIECESMNISDITGIEAFVNLTKLNVNDNDISSVDFSANINLTELVVRDNLLTSLDVSNLSSLIVLVSGHNDITNFD